MPANTKGSTGGRIIKILCESLALLLGAVQPPEDLLLWRDTIKEQLTPKSHSTAGKTYYVARPISQCKCRITRAQHSRHQTHLCNNLPNDFGTWISFSEALGSRPSLPHYRGQKIRAGLECRLEVIESQLRRVSPVEQLRASLRQRVAIIRTRLEGYDGTETQRFATLQGQPKHVVGRDCRVGARSGKVTDRF